MYMTTVGGKLRSISTVPMSMDSATIKQLGQVFQFNILEVPRYKFLAINKLFVIFNSIFTNNRLLLNSS